MYKRQVEQGPPPCGFGFSTKIEDPETCLVYYGYRYLKTLDGRWISKDPIGEEGGANLYGFVQNDPLCFSDSLGQQIYIGGGKYTHEKSRDQAGNSLDNYIFGSAQSDRNIERFAIQIKDALQEIIGDCAKLILEDGGKENLPGSAKGRNEAVVRSRYRLAFTDEKGKCKCDDCWKVLKAAIQKKDLTITFRYVTNRDNEWGTTEGSNRTAYVNPQAAPQVVERDHDGTLHWRSVPFAISAWHEAIGHAYRGVLHKNIPENHIPSWDGNYYDPVIQDENLARACTRRQGREYVKVTLFFGMIALEKGRFLSERHPAYYPGR